jgi:hypothetical protein
MYSTVSAAQDAQMLHHAYVGRYNAQFYALLAALISLESTFMNSDVWAGAGVAELPFHWQPKVWSKDRGWNWRAEFG